MANTQRSYSKQAVIQQASGDQSSAPQNLRLPQRRAIGDREGVVVCLGDERPGAEAKLGEARGEVAGAGLRVGAEVGRDSARY